MLKSGLLSTSSGASSGVLLMGQKGGGVHVVIYNGMFFRNVEDGFIGPLWCLLVLL